MKDLAQAELLTELRSMRPLLEASGVRRLALFGSRARQDNRLDSDIDLAIDLDDRHKFSLIDLVGVGHLVEDKVGLPANIFVRRSLDSEFRAQLDREQVVVF